MESADDCASSSSSAASTYQATTPSSTNFVDDALVTSADERDGTQTPLIPWRTGADALDRQYVYVGHTRWLVDRTGERPMAIRIRRKVVLQPPLPPPRRYTIVDEDGISRDFFLIIALCFVLAILLIVFLRPIALEILWYYID